MGIGSRNRKVLINNKTGNLSRLALAYALFCMLIGIGFDNGLVAGDLYCNGINNNNEEKSDSTDNKLVLITDSANLVISKRPAGDYTESYLTNIIDSLLDLDEIPMDVIDQIMFYSTKNIVPERPYFPFPTDTSVYPANLFYHSWNTTHPHPYTSELSDNDTSITLVLADSISNCGFDFPLNDSVVITSKYGYRDGRFHKGIDLDLNVWDPVKSIFPGVVRVAKWQGAYGRVVVVRHYNGFETVYAHLHRLKVKPGQEVEAGQVVGLGGSSGRSTGSHLHFEVRFKGLPINPQHFISFEEKTLVNDTVEIRKLRWSYAAIPLGCKIHTVKRGESLYLIARQYATTTRKLARLNGISRNKPLSVGQKLRIS